jgi:hypothetical protein
MRKTMTDLNKWFVLSKYGTFSAHYKAANGQKEKT